MKKINLLILVVCCACVMQAQVLTLDSCLNSARQKNCTIQSALLDVQISQQVKKQVFTKYFPQVSLTGFAFHAYDPLVSIYMPGLMPTKEGEDAVAAIFDLIKEKDPNITPNIDMLHWGGAAGATLIQPIFMGGRIINGNKLAKVGIAASEKQVEISERDVLQEVEDTYWLVAGLYEKRSTVQEVNQLLDTIEHIAQVAYNNGLVTQNDLIKVQLKKNEIDTKSVQLEDGIVLASKLLCQLTGIEYTGELELDTFPKENAVEAYVLVDTFLVSGRPEAELLEMNIQAEQLRKKMTIGEALPEIIFGLQGGYSNFFKQDRWNGFAVAAVQIPLTQWWETGHKIKEHNLRIEKAKMLQEDLMGKMALQNEQVYNQLNEAVRLVVQQESGVKMAEDNFRISEMNYKAGMTTMSELLESQALFLQAQNALTDARISMRAAQRKFNDLNK